MKINYFWNRYEGRKPFEIISFYGKCLGNLKIVVGAYGFYFIYLILVRMDMFDGLKRFSKYAT